MSALSIRHIDKTYSTGVQALRDVSLDIEEGDFFALLGANGAGKTTLISIITGLVVHSGGTLEVFGIDADKNPNEAKRLVGVVPQEFNFNMFEKVIDIVVNQAGYYGIPKSVAVPRASELLDTLGLGDKKNVVSRTLSGGMKRRLMIARALVHSPRLLILDEPTAGVDVELRIGMWEYLTRLNRDEGVTIVLTTHYLEEVEQLCRHVAFIKGGEIVRQDSVKNTLKSLGTIIYTLETGDTGDLADAPAGLAVVDPHTIDLTVDERTPLNNYFAYLNEKKVSVQAIKPKDNALETIFLNILKK